MDYKEANISGLKIQYRKWKVRDKIELDKIELDSNLTTLEKQLRKRNVFVYNCLKDPVLLDIEQYNYVLSLIREYSLHSPIEFTLECNKCNEQFIANYNTLELISFKEFDFSDIAVSNLKFSLGNISNPDYDRDILNAFSLSERFILDFAYHVTKVNDKEVKLNDVIEMLQDLDVDEYQEIFKRYNSQRAICNFTKTVKCPKCGLSDLYEFNNLSTFFPQSWSV